MRKIYYGKIKVIIASILMTGCISLLDYYTGDELSVSIFYLIPVSYSAWFAGRNAGLIFSVFSAAVWLTLEKLNGVKYSHELIQYWNALTRFGFFIIVSVILNRLKVNLQIERRLSRSDSLTGISNVREFTEKLSNELERSRRYNEPVTLVFIDIDDFKNINDRFGHNAGDETLKGIVCVIKRNIRNTDTIGRLGGDEFAVILPYTDFRQAETAVNKISNAVRESSHTGFEIKPTISSGYATFTDIIPDTVTAVKAADDMMYEVKRSGKNGVKGIIYTEDIIS